MIKRHKILFYFIGLLLLIQIVHLFMFFGLNYFDDLSLDLKTIVLLIGFQIIMAVGIFFTVKLLKTDLTFEYIWPGSKIIIYALILFVFVYIVQTVFERSFFDHLGQGELRFLQFNFTVREGFYGKTAAFLSILFVPLLEELLYRRIIFKKLLEQYSLPLSLVISSFLFAIMHLDLEGLLAYFLVGMAFAYLYYLTRVLWLNVLIHALFNLTVRFTTLKTYPEMDSFYVIGLIIYLICGLGIFLILKRIRSLSA